MNIAAIKDQITRHEGCVLHAYDDHLGYTTIGVGRLIDERRGGGISYEEAMILLENDIQEVVEQLRGEDGFDNFPEPIQQALVNMAFQLGVSGLKSFQNMWNAIKQKDYDKAFEEALDSKWATQTPERAKEIAEIIRNG